MLNALFALDNHCASCWMRCSPLTICLSDCTVAAEDEDMLDALFALDHMSLGLHYTEAAEDEDAARRCVARDDRHAVGIHAH
jgi:hypothetical protein